MGLLAFAGTALVFTVTATPAFAQDPGLPAAKPATRPVFTARLVQPLQRARTVRTDSVTWSCRERVCTTTDSGGQWPDLDTCRSLRREIGEIEGFGHAGGQLSASELRLCNSPLLDRPPGAVVFGDGRPGARPPDAAGSRPGEITLPELAIVEVRRGRNRRIRVGEEVPVHVMVRNSGDGGITVRPAARDLSQGTARLTHGTAAPIGPGETVVLELDLLATGSGFSMDGRGGGALCGERSERTIFLLEAPAPSNPSGWRSGNSAGADAWLPFHDRNDADHERTVSFRFDCSVTLER